MGARRTRLLLGVAASTVVLGTSACTGEDTPSETGRPVSPPAVELAPEGAPEALSVGVVVSLSSAPDEGAQWNEAAEGAQVAAYRYGLGDVDVEIVPRDDQGTAEGAEAAVTSLADEGVSGIVMATEGDHVNRALDAAAEAGVPVLLPYADGAGELPEGVWTTGADAGQVSSTLAAALESTGVTRPAVVDAGGGPVDVDEAGTVTLRSGNGAAVAARVVRLSRSAAGADSVVVTGPAELQARAVHALQERNVTLPVFLTDDAVSPAFSTALEEAGGSLSTPLTTAGLDTDDVAALAPGTEGAAVSAYLAALRVTAEDGEVTDYFDDEKFETVAGAADARTHDAVVALVTAAAAAGSADATDVRDALSGLTADQGDGLAGPALDFTAAPAAVADDAVVPLQATTQDPGLRPVDLAGAPRLYWFESPTA